MTYRPYPNRIRALKQIEKNRFPLVRARTTAAASRSLSLSWQARSEVRRAAGVPRADPLRRRFGRDIGDIRDMTEDEVATLRRVRAPVQDGGRIVVGDTPKRR